MAEVNTILDLIKRYWYLIPIIVIGFMAFIMWQRRPRERKFRPISRREYDRKMFEERMKLNPTPIKFLYKGNELMGRIKYLRGTKISKEIKEMQKIKTEDGGEYEAEVIKDIKKNEIYEMVVQPFLIPSLKIVNPFAKPQCIVCLAKNTTYNWGGNFIEIDFRKPFDQVYGIYYQLDEEFNLVDFIQDKSIFRVDMEKTSDQYFAESLKRSAIDQEHAHAEAMAREELEIELARRRGKQSTI